MARALPKLRVNATLDTGLRRSFFLFVFGFLIATIMIVSSLQLFFFENERLRLLDQRLETIASTLFASGLSIQVIDNLDSTDDLIHDLLGEERVDQIINVYSLKGEQLARNFTSTELPLEFSRNERWQTLEVKGRSIRVLNIENGNLVVQVGMVLGPSLLNKWSVVNHRFAFFFFSVILLLVGVAYFSSGILFSPLRKLTRELGSMSEQLDRKLGQPISRFVIGPELTRLTQGGKKTKDEFELLCDEIRIFLTKLENYTKTYHAQTAILTHELKTPLTVLKNYLDSLKTAPDLQKARDLGVNAVAEIDHLSQLINDYLQWSVLAANPGQPDEIHAVRLVEVCKKTIADLNRLNGERIELSGHSDTMVFALPDHVRQLLTNLLSNSLKYSDAKVSCRLEKEAVVVSDQGQGLPATVCEHMGSPFNRGPARTHTSSGLGLAWVHSLCEKYGWKLQIESTSSGTKIRIGFA